jgi:hypothetical protein
MDKSARTPLGSTIQTDANKKVFMKSNKSKQSEHTPDLPVLQPPETD